MIKQDVAARYAQIRKILLNKEKQIVVIMQEMGSSENYTRKLIADLLLTGHVTEHPYPGPYGRPIRKYSWRTGKSAPTCTPEKQKAPRKFYRTDPLMIALYGSK